MVNREQETDFDEINPLGPVEAYFTNDYFDRCFNRDNLLYRTLKRNPTTIIGRRGSGKTSLLFSAAVDRPDDIVVRVSQEEIFDAARKLPPLPPEKVERLSFFEIVHGVRELTDEFPFVEQISSYWDFLFWIAIMQEIVFRNQTSADEYVVTIRTFLEGLGVDVKQPAFLVWSILLHNRSRLVPHDGMGVHFITGNEVLFYEAKDAALNYLDTTQKSALLLLDALEDFELGREDMGRTVAGLIRCVGQFHQPGSRVGVRFCLPAELYHKFLSLSFNPLKDFKRTIILHWAAGELIQLAAHRYSVFLQKVDQRRFEGLRKNIDIDTRQGAIEFWHRILPAKIMSRFGVEEDPLAYILRHTQLLPRHVLQLFNSITAVHLANNGDAFEISSDVIPGAVRDGQLQVLYEVLRGYHFSYPNCEEMLRTFIPKLPICFTAQHIDKIFTRKAGGAFGFYSSNDLIAALAEIGAVGRVVDETPRYYEGEFEFMIPGRLVPSDHDRFCLHPIVSENFNAKYDRQGKGEKAVYPYNYDLVSDGDRDWIYN